MKFSTIHLTQKNLPEYQASLEVFEAHFDYPLGTDSFKISHGSNYLAFFERMGKPQVYACLNGKQVVAVGGGVLHSRLNSWYLCDMKVHPEFRGHKLPVRLFRKHFLLNYLRNQRGFALTMESEFGRPNPIMKIMERLPWTPLKKGARIFFFYEGKKETELVLPYLSEQRPNLTFSSLRGKKDLILKSTGHPIPLLHLEWGNYQGERLTMKEDALHMWALWEGNPMMDVMARAGIKPKGSGLIFEHRMRPGYYDEIRTSEL